LGRAALEYICRTLPTHYTGQYSDSYTDGLASQGVYWIGSRLYDPVLGRFLQPDPLIPEAYNPLAFDRYRYAYSNPIRYIDSSGHTPWDVVDVVFSFLASMTLRIILLGEMQDGYC